MILKKFAKKINKEALKRVLSFFRDKYRGINELSEENQKRIGSMNNFLEKISEIGKNTENREQEVKEDEEESNEEEDEEKENYDQRDRIPVPMEREGVFTRSSRKY